MKNAPIKRGDIYSLDFGPNSGSIQGGRRPCVVLQNDIQNARSPTTIIAPITTVLKKTSLPSHVIIGRNFGLQVESMILLEQIRTVNRNNLGKLIGHIDEPALMHLIDIGLTSVLSIQPEGTDWEPKATT